MLKIFRFLYKQTFNFIKKLININPFDIKYLNLIIKNTNYFNVYYMFLLFLHFLNA